MPIFDANDASCTIDVYKEGLFSAAGHDVRLQVQAFTVRVEDGQIEADFDATSIRTAHAMRNGAPDPSALSESDRATIDRYVHNDILRTTANGRIRFASEEIDDLGDELDIVGTLELNGRLKTLNVTATERDDQWVTRIPIHQPDFGIAPFKALMGALKIKPTLDIELTVPKVEGLF